MQLDCGYFKRNVCRSCTLLDNSLEDIAKIKVDSLRQLFPQLKSEQISPIVTPTQIFPSRAKAKFSVSGTTSEPIIGLIDENYSGKELLNCPLHFPILNQIVNFVHQQIPLFALSPYDIELRRGELKGLILTCNAAQSEVIVRFVARSRTLIDQIRLLLPTALTKFPQVKVVSVNLQPLPAAILEGPEEVFLTDCKQIFERFGDLQLSIGAQSFVQVTPEIAEQLYQFVAGEVAKRRPEVMADLYCGVGGFSLSAARHAGQIYGIELSESAIANAKRGAELNGQTNLTFLADDVVRFFAEFEETRFSLLVVNPPRRGIPLELIEGIRAKGIQTVIYSSCNPTTLLRDLELLSADYDCLSLNPFDMFPLTNHLEVVAILERRPVASKYMRHGASE